MDDYDYFNSSTGRATYSTGTYCSNFSELINYEVAWNKKHRDTDLIVDWAVASTLYKELKPPRAKYENIHSYLKEMYRAMDDMRNAADDPTGSLQTYSQATNNYAGNYMSAKRDLEMEASFSVD